jgi:hypothetical protein
MRALAQSKYRFMRLPKRLFHAKALPAIWTKPKNRVNGSCGPEAAWRLPQRVATGQSVPTSLRPFSLILTTFWLALLLISGWAEHAAKSQQTQQLLPLIAPGKTDAPSPAGGQLKAGQLTSKSGLDATSAPVQKELSGAPAIYVAPQSNRQGGKTYLYEQMKFDPADLPVLVRPRPGLDPQGARLGGFLVFPELKLSEFYDDNIYRTNSNSKGDFLTEIAPRLRISSNWSENLLTFEAGAAIGRYMNYTSENYEDFGTRLKGLLVVTNASHFDGEISYDRKHADRDSPDDAKGIHPTVYYDAVSTAGFFQQLGRFTLRLDANAERLDYDNNESVTGGIVTEINNDDRDRDQIGGTVRIGYRPRQDIETYVQAGYGVIRYDSSPDDNGFQRDATTYDAIAGLATDWNGIFESDVHLGYMARTLDDPRFDTIDGFDFGGKLAWNVTRLTTLSASLSRRISVTTINQAAGSLITEAGVAVDHELRRDLLLHLGAKWRQNDYSGIDRIDDTYEIGIGANYFITRNFNVGASYTYRQRNSNLPTAEYVENLILFDLDAGF